MSDSRSMVLDMIGEALQGINNEDLNKNNLIDKIAEALKVKCPDLYEHWKDDNYDVNNIFDYSDIVGWTEVLLNAAVRQRLWKVTGALLGCGADVDHTGHLGNIFRLVAQCDNGSIDKDTVAGFVATRDNIDAPLGIMGNSPLLIAIQERNEHIINILIDLGADVNAKGGYERTPLSHTLQCGNEHIANILIDRGANVNAVDQGGRTPLHLAPHYCNEHIANILIDRGANVNAEDEDERTPLHLAAQYGDEHIANILVDRGANVNARDKVGRTPLHLVPKYYNKRIANILIDRGANVDAKDKDERTPLHIAASSLMFREDDRVSILIDKGADVNAEDKDKCTPLYLAIRCENMNAIYCLTRSKANISAIHVHAVDENGRTPLHIACMMDNIRLVMTLINRGHAFLLKDKNDKTPKDLTIDEQIKQLLEKAETRYVEESEHMKKFIGKIFRVKIGKLPVENWFEITRYYNNLDLRKFLSILVKDEDCLLYLSDAQIVNLISYAARYTTENECKNIVNALLKQGVDVNVKNSHGRTLLHIAVEHKYEDLANVLIDQGADVDAIDSDGRTPLHVGAISYYIPQALLDSANPFIKDKDGRKPSDLALTYRAYDVNVKLRKSSWVYLLLKSSEGKENESGIEETKKFNREIIRKAKNKVSVVVITYITLVIGYSILCVNLAERSLQANLDMTTLAILSLLAIAVPILAIWVWVCYDKEPFPDTEINKVKSEAITNDLLKTGNC